MASTRSKLSCVVLCAGLTASCAHGPSDATILTTIQAGVARERALSSYSVGVESRGGVVTLTGTVESNDAKVALEGLVKTTSGVKSLTSNVTVPAGRSPSTVPPPNDDAIVSEVRSRIASDPLLGPQPIDVTSNSGVVTLSGAVETEEQKARAEQTARQINGVANLINDLKLVVPVLPPKGKVVPPPKVTLTADPVLVVLPNSPKTTLRYTAANATELDLKSRVGEQEDEIGKVDTHGTSIDEYPKENTEYVLTAVGPGGTREARLKVNVWKTEVTVPPTAALTGSPQSIHPGESATLTYTSSGAASLEVEPEVGKVGPPSGSARVSPQKTQTYTLTATGPGGTVTAPFTVMVTQPRDIVVPPDTFIMVRLDAGVDTASSKGQVLRATVLSSVGVSNLEVIPASAQARVVLSNIKKTILEKSEATLELQGLTVGGSELLVRCYPYTIQGPRVINPRASQVIIHPGTTIPFRLLSPLAVPASQ